MLKELVIHFIARTVGTIQNCIHISADGKISQDAMVGSQIRPLKRDATVRNLNLD
ncbi:MAG: hypothetical protein ACYCPR_05575 [Thermoplasmataceae archaeon]